MVIFALTAKSRLNAWSLVISQDSHLDADLRRRVRHFSLVTGDAALRDNVVNYPSFSSVLTRTLTRYARDALVGALLVRALAPYTAALATALQAKYAATDRLL